MGQLVRISIGEWSKSAAGCWQFEGDPSAVDKYIVARSNENINSFTSPIWSHVVQWYGHMFRFHLFWYALIEPG